MLATVRRQLPSELGRTFPYFQTPDAERVDRRGSDVKPVIRFAVEQLPHGVLIVDGTGDVLAANRVAEAVFGYDAGQLNGRPIENLLPDAAGDILSLWLISEAGSLVQNESPVRLIAGVGRDGVAVRLEARFEMAGDGAARRIVVTFVDATRRLTEADAVPFALRRVIADLALRFVNIDPDTIDDALNDSLRQVAEGLDLEYAALWRAEADDEPLSATHEWSTRSRDEAGADIPPALVRSIEAALHSGQAMWRPGTPSVGDALDESVVAASELGALGIVPLAGPRASGTCGDALVIGATASREWPASVVEQLILVSCVFGQALARQANVRAMQEAHEETRRLRAAGEWVAASGGEAAAPAAIDRSKGKDLCFRRDVELPASDCTIVGNSAPLQRVLQQVRQVATTDSTVLLLGETGTGKELLAEMVHELSARRSREMVCVNCSAIPSTLMESELFGRERGAFTGAVARQIGRFELSDRSTLFLDEIGELSPDIQVKLLRVLETRQIERLGSPNGVRVDVRIIAATHRELEQAIAEDKFREDLFYRLNVFPIRVPPLRDRVEDIPLLVWRFVDEFAKTLRKPIEAIPRASLIALQHYSWPGNIRQLRNVVERAMIVATGKVLTIEVPASAPGTTTRSSRMADVEKEHIRRVLESTGWRIRGAQGAADRLGLRPTTLETRMMKLGLRRPCRPEPS